jgi:hypothetical protein
MTDSNVRFRSVASATLGADNSADASRTVEITSDVYFSGTEVTGFGNGHATVVGRPESVCHFSESGGSSISTDFNNFADTDAQVAALREIKAFVTAVRASGASAFNLSPRQDYE